MSKTFTQNLLRLIKFNIVTQHTHTHTHTHVHTQTDYHMPLAHAHQSIMIYSIVCFDEYATVIAP